MRKKLVWWGMALVVVMIVGYAAASAYIYGVIRSIGKHCDDYPYAAYVPEDFQPRVGFEDSVDIAAYQIDAPYETVRYPSRNQPDITIAAWYLPALDTPTDAPTVIVQHGLSSCRRAPTVLMAASMLHEAGYHVLIPDLSDHGESTIVDERFSAGVEEHLDVLGGFDWLVTERGVSPDNVALMGFSLGAGTASIAFSQEPQLAALWSDSAFSDLEKTIAYELRDQYRLPAIFASGAITYGQIVDNMDVTEFSPIDAFGAARDGRPVFITHGTADSRLSVDFAYDLEAAAQSTDPDFEAWILDGVGHTDAIFMYPDEYNVQLIAFFDDAFGRED